MYKLVTVEMINVFGKKKKKNSCFTDQWGELFCLITSNKCCAFMKLKLQ